MSHAMTYEHLSPICLLLWPYEDDLPHPCQVKCFANQKFDSNFVAIVIVKDCAAEFRACQPCIQLSA